MDLWIRTKNVLIRADILQISVRDTPGDGPKISDLFARSGDRVVRLVSDQPFSFLEAVIEHIFDTMPSFTVPSDSGFFFDIEKVVEEVKEKTT